MLCMQRRESGTPPRGTYETGKQGGKNYGSRRSFAPLERPASAAVQRSARANEPAIQCHEMSCIARARQDPRATAGGSKQIPVEHADISTISITISSLRVRRFNTWTTTLSPSSILQPCVHKLLCVSWWPRKQSKARDKTIHASAKGADDDGVLRTVHTDVAPSVQVDVFFPRLWRRFLLSGTIVHRDQYPRGLRLVPLIMPLCL